MSYEPIDKKGIGKKSTSTGVETSTVSKGKKGGAVPQIDGKGKHTTGYGPSTAGGPKSESGTLPANVTERGYSDTPKTPARGRRIRDGVSTGPGIVHKDG